MDEPLPIPALDAGQSTQEKIGSKGDFNVKGDRGLDPIIQSKEWDNQEASEQDNQKSGEKNKDTGEDTPPDEKYHKKARALADKYPHTFVLDYPTSEKRMALTFDDGPDDSATPEILDILENRKIKATFFVVGINILRHPKIVERMIEGGHQIANHSWSHLRPTEISGDELIKEIGSTQEIISDSTGSSRPLYYRPPYGLLTIPQIEILQDKGYLAISWSIDSLDWAGASPEEIQKKVLGSAYPGAIVLMHSAGGKDHRQNTVKALPKIVDDLLGQGYEFVTIDSLLNGK